MSAEPPLAGREAHHPVRNIDPGARVFLATYDSPVLTEVKRQIGPCETLLFDPKGSSQLETFKQALLRIRNRFSVLVATRFDLEFQKPFDQWAVAPDENALFFPWREYEGLWANHNRVSDTVHIIGKNQVEPFIKTIEMCQLAGKSDLHYAYYYMRSVNGGMCLDDAALKFIEDGFWDSNTMGDAPQARNPLYRICNRKA